MAALSPNLHRQVPDRFRWWGATGLVALGPKAAPAEDKLRKATQDVSPEVRMAATEARRIHGIGIPRHRVSTNTISLVTKIKAG